MPHSTSRAQERSSIEFSTFVYLDREGASGTAITYGPESGPVYRQAGGLEEGSRWCRVSAPPDLEAKKSASGRDASVSTQYFGSHLNSIRINNLLSFLNFMGHFCNPSGVCGVRVLQSGGVAGAKPPATLFQAFGLRLSRNVPFF
jgi:hypothetical protein